LKSTSQLAGESSSACQALSKPALFASRAWKLTAGDSSKVASLHNYHFLCPSPSWLILTSTLQASGESNSAWQALFESALFASIALKLTAGDGSKVVSLHIYCFLCPSPSWLILTSTSQPAGESNSACWALSKSTKLPPLSVEDADFPNEDTEEPVGDVGEFPEVAEM